MSNVEKVGSVDVRKIRELLKLYDSGDMETATQLANEVIFLSESHLYQEVGRLTRELHDALQAFRLDDRVMTLTKEEIPDAKERLNYVIAMTEQSANKVLNAVEESLPISEAINKRSREYQAQWERFMNRKLQLNEFKDLCTKLTDYFEWSTANSDKLRDNLANVLMAQDFQDLTGQIIKKVITLVNEVESSLVEIIKITSEKIQIIPSQHKHEITDNKDKNLAGPRVPGVNDEGMIRSQDDVDDLLSSLGF